MSILDEEKIRDKNIQAYDNLNIIPVDDIEQVENRIKVDVTNFLKKDTNIFHKKQILKQLTPEKIKELVLVDEVKDKGNSKQRFVQFGQIKNKDSYDETQIGYIFNKDSLAPNMAEARFGIKKDQMKNPAIFSPLVDGDMLMCPLGVTQLVPIKVVSQITKTILSLPEATIADNSVGNFCFGGCLLTAPAVTPCIPTGEWTLFNPTKKINGLNKLNSGSIFICAKGGGMAVTVTSSQVKKKKS